MSRQAMPRWQPCRNELVVFGGSGNSGGGSGGPTVLFTLNSSGAGACHLTTTWFLVGLLTGDRLMSMSYVEFKKWQSCPLSHLLPNFHGDFKIV